ISGQTTNNTPAKIHSTISAFQGALSRLALKRLRGTQFFAGPRNFASRLSDLLGLCWSLGIPVIHLRVFPLTSKRMAAMAIRTGNRHVILIGRDAMFPAPVAYYIAHELGHIFRGHLSENSAIVDLEMPDELHERDSEETEADDFGLSLLSSGICSGSCYSLR
ncbi:MAG: hypothetical protein LV479_13270, partial [Methylacidiphilales bacterium]|nr:hypothetical protein [Candidatus Methylacidiphilales bacterium]